MIKFCLFKYERYIPINIKLENYFYMALNLCSEDIYILIIAVCKHELKFFKSGLILVQTTEFEFYINSVPVILYI